MIEDLKASNKRRDTESRIIADQVYSLKDVVPKALEGWKAGGDTKLEELGQELQSLKKLLENRVGRPGASTQTPAPTGRGYPPPEANGGETSRENVTAFASTNTGSGSQTPEPSSNSPAPAPGVTVPKRDSSTPRSGLGRSDRRAAIPAWQMAASGKSGTSAPSANSEGSATEAGA